MIDEKKLLNELYKYETKLYKIKECGTKNAKTTPEVDDCIKEIGKIRDLISSAEKYQEEYHLTAEQSSFLNTYQYDTWDKIKRWSQTEKITPMCTEKFLKCCLSACILSKLASFRKESDWSMFLNIEEDYAYYIHGINGITDRFICLIDKMIFHDYNRKTVRNLPTKPNKIAAGYSCPNCDMPLENGIRRCPKCNQLIGWNITD